MMDWGLLEKHITDGTVFRTQHPTLPLALLNYSAKCQADRLWDEVTLQCRGLVVRDREIAARPFRKFFNDREHAADEIPWHLPSVVTEKLDGSLLIWFCHDGEWIAATRGSFTSHQSAVGRQLIESTYRLDDFDSRHTYLFEVIYPENRIVVNYGDRREVVLLAIVDTATGKEIEHDADVFHAVRRLPPTVPHNELRSIISDTEEGYVIRFANGFRVKIKGERYMYLHKIVSGISSRMVWENLSVGKSFDEVLEIVPDEFAKWVIAQRKKLQSQFNRIASDASFLVTEALRLGTRKEQALYIINKNKELAPVAFAWLDNKDYDKVIWKMVYPEYERPEGADETT